MKVNKTITYLFLTLIAAVAIQSCTEDSAGKATVKTTVGANELQAPVASSTVLTFPNKDKVFEVFKWSATDFGFPASVTYRLQLDKASGTFTSPATLGTTTSTELSITVGVLNDYLLGLGLPDGVAAQVKLRVTSTLTDKVATVISNERTITVTPYPSVLPSYYGRGAGLNGWGNWGDGLEVEFTSTDNNVYWTYAYLVTGETWRLFKLQDWGAQSWNYLAMTGGVDTELINANDGDKNFRNDVPSGWYKITFTFSTLKVDVEAATEPLLYMVGDGIPSAGWAWNTPVKLKFISPGIWQNTTAVSFLGSGAFRFFKQANWGDGYNYPYFTSVDAKFMNANDGDKNLKLVAANGTHKLRVDVTRKKTSVVP